jgi:DNA-binding NarL/FixJ family response regulator
MSTPRLRVVVVDDSEVVRTKLRSLLRSDQRFELVGEAPDGETALGLAQQLQPDLVVMDLRMPGISGIEATWRLGTISPQSRVLVLTVSEEQEDVADAIMAGARGYVVKGAQDEDIRAALSGVAAGERVISPQVAGKLIERVRGDGAEGKLTTPSPAAPAAPRVPTPAPRPVRRTDDLPAPAGASPVPLGLVQVVAIVGAAVITAIGQGEEILDGTTTADTWIKAGINLIVSLAIANLAVLLARVSR